MARHPGVEGVLRWLQPNTNLPPKQLDIAETVHVTAVQLLNAIPNDGPELTAGLRKLLEAKDCFVRASLEEPR